MSFPLSKLALMKCTIQFSTFTTSIEDHVEKKYNHKHCIVEPSWRINNFNLWKRVFLFKCLDLCQLQKKKAKPRNLWIKKIKINTFLSFTFHNSRFHQDYWNMTMDLWTWTDIKFLLKALKLSRKFCLML